jgi:hypothetical protein
MPPTNTGNYDPETESGNSTRSSGGGLSNSTGTGNASFSHGDNLDPVRRQEREGGGFWRPGSNTAGSNTTSSPEGGASDSAGKGRGGAQSPTGGARAEGSGALKNQEEGDGTIGSGYQGDEAKAGAKKKRGQFSRIFSSRRRNTIVGGTFVAVTGTGAVVFFGLLPLKIESLVTEVRDHFSSSQNAVDDEAQNLFDKYITERVLPGYKNCGTTISRKCSAVRVGNSSNPVTALYDAWSTSRVEDSLAKAGIEIAYKPHLKRWYVITTNHPDGVDCGENCEKITQVLNKEPEARAALKVAFKENTEWYQMWTRYKWGRYAEEKDAVHRCNLYCGATDPLRNSIKDQKIAGQLLFNRIVVGRHDEALAAAIKCVFDTACDPSQPDQRSSDPADNGGAESSAEADIESSLDAYAAKEGVDAAAMKAYLADIEKDGIQNTVVKAVITKVFPSLAGSSSVDTALDAVPYVGWINFGTQVINAANGAGPKLQALGFIVNTKTMETTAILFETEAHEIHTGQVTGTEIGSIVGLLGSNTTHDPKNPVVGGTASAEQSPLYADVINHNSKASSKSYKCKNGKGVPAGKFICHEEEASLGSGAANDLHNALTAPGVNILTAFSTLWGGSVGQVFNLASSAFGALAGLATGVAGAACGLPLHIGYVINILPGYCEAQGLIHKIGPQIMDDVVGFLIPSPLGENNSGARMFNNMTGGFDSLNASYGQHGIGGRLLSKAQVASITNEHETEAKREFSQRPFFARMFSTDTQYSLVSQLATAVPTDFSTSIQSGFASLIDNPLHAFSGMFSSMFTKASAVAAPAPDPFGIPQYGYTDQDIANIGDAETYWNNNCVDDASQGYQKDNSYNNAGAAKINSQSGMPENDSTDPCMLIKTSVGAAGGIFDTGLLAKDDLGDLNNSSGGFGTAPVSAGTYASPFHDEANLTPSRVDEGVDYASTAPVPLYAIGNGVVTEVAKGNSTFYPALPNWITYKLSDGPAAGKDIYVAEDCPPLVNVGDKVSPSTGPLCNVQPASIETGWAMNDTTQAAAAYGSYSESHATAYGQNFEELMESLGVKTKACYDHPGEQLEGSLPSGWPKWVPNPASTAGSNAC